MFYDGLRNRFTWHGRILFCIVPLCSFSGRNPHETRAPFARMNIAIIQTLTGGMRTHGRGRGGCSVQQTPVSPYLKKLGTDMCWEVGSKNKKQTPYIFNKDGVCLKIHEKYVFLFPFIPHTDVIFQQISKYKPHASNKESDFTGSQQKTERNMNGCGYFILAYGAVRSFWGNYTATSNIPYPTAFPYGNGMVLHFYQQQESSTTKTVHRVINKRLKTYV